MAVTSACQFQTFPQCGCIFTLSLERKQLPVNHCGCRMRNAVTKRKRGRKRKTQEISDCGSIQFSWGVQKQWANLGSFISYALDKYIFFADAGHFELCGWLWLCGMCVCSIPCVSTCQITLFHSCHFAVLVLVCRMRSWFHATLVDQIEYLIATVKDVLM